MESLWYWFWELRWYEIAFVALYITGALPLVVNEVVCALASWKKVLALIRERPLLALVTFIDRCLGIVLCAPGNGYIQLRESIIKSIEK